MGYCFPWQAHTLVSFGLFSSTAAHVLVIPKIRSNLTRFRNASMEHVEILGLLMVAAAEISKDSSLGFGDGARIVINDGPDGGQGMCSEMKGDMFPFQSTFSFQTYIATLFFTLSKEVGHLHVHVLGGRALSWPPG